MISAKLSKYSTVKASIKTFIISFIYSKKYTYQTPLKGDYGIVEAKMHPTKGKDFKEVGECGFLLFLSCYNNLVVMYPT